MRTEPAAIAVDGGGSRCRAAAWVAGERYVVDVEGANITTDFERGVAAVIAATDRLAHALDADLARWTDVPVYLGLAGVTDSGVARAVADRLPFQRAQVQDDRPAAVRGALGTADGALVHCGTGSFFAVQRAGALRSAGGWGAVLGDHGSAMWVGREALTAVLDTHDGLVPATELTKDLLSRFGSPTGVVRFARDATPTALGALAPEVTRAAERGDACAVDILLRGAAGAVEVLEAMGWDDSLAIRLTGGLGPHYQPPLESDLGARVQAPAGTPLDGALSLAGDYAARCRADTADAAVLPNEGRGA
ncbi:MAG: BadF/BadG/BcrA/BcrD ATPase family protein [Pseudomonadota bacterium]